MSIPLFIAGKVYDLKDKRGQITRRTTFVSYTPNEDGYIFNGMIEIDGYMDPPKITETEQGEWSISKQDLRNDYIVREYNEPYRGGQKYKKKTNKNKTNKNKTNKNKKMKK